MLERDFQAHFIARLYEEFPGCVVLKNDPNYIQGFPDLTILWRDRWAVLECKRSVDEPFRPNQPYYIKTLNQMSYSSAVFPENEEVVICELKTLFSS